MAHLSASRLGIGGARRPLPILQNQACSRAFRTGFLRSSLYPLRDRRTHSATCPPWHSNLTRQIVTRHAHGCCCLGLSCCVSSPRSILAVAAAPTTAAGRRTTLFSAAPVNNYYILGCNRACRTTSDRRPFNSPPPPDDVPNPSSDACALLSLFLRPLCLREGVPEALESLSTILSVS